MEGTVTKELKNAMKKADSIKIKLTQDHAEIVCLKDISTKDGFAGTIESRFGNFETKLPKSFATASFADILHKKYRGNYAALEMLIKPDDQLIFRCLDNSSKCLEDKKLHNDTLYVTVCRGKELILADFILDISITPDNSARALK